MRQQKQFDILASREAQDQLKEILEILDIRCPNRITSFNQLSATQAVRIKNRIERLSNSELKMRIIGIQYSHKSPRTGDASKSLTNQDLSAIRLQVFGCLAQATDTKLNTDTNLAIFRAFGSGSQAVSISTQASEQPETDHFAQIHTRRYNEYKVAFVI